MNYLNQNSCIFKSKAHHVTFFHLDLHRLSVVQAHTPHVFTGVLQCVSHVGSHTHHRTLANFMKTVGAQRHLKELHTQRFQD